MRKIVIGLLIPLVALFAVITLVKQRTSQAISDRDNQEKSFADKQRIHRFWEAYRQATEHRIAGRLHEAANEYQRAVELNNKHEDALYYLGNVYFQLGDLRAAEQTWKNLVQINPNSARAHFQLGGVYLMFEHEEVFDIEAAEGEFRRTLDINKEETAPLLRLGQIALIRGSLSDAKDYFDAVIRSNFRNVEAHVLRGYIEWKGGNMREALTFLLKAGEIARPPHSSPEGLNLMGPFLTSFADLSELNEADISQQMDTRYEKLGTILEQIRKRIQS